MYLGAVFLKFHIFHGAYLLGILKYRSPLESNKPLHNPLFYGIIALTLSAAVFVERSCANMNQEEWIEFYNLLKQLNEEQLAAFIQALRELQEPEESRQPVSACLLKD